MLQCPLRTYAPASPEKRGFPETEAAAKQISKFLAMLAAYYKQDFNNELEL